ncbi:MAG: flavin reductase family protein [Acidimicrobiales bacterium]
MTDISSEADLDVKAASSLDEARFRQVLGHFATGVTVVTAHDDHGPAGFTCQSFMSVSLEPPLIAFAPGATSATWPRIAATGAFCVNVLRQDQEDLCRVFATKGDAKFDGVGWKPGPNGSPVLTDALAWVDCRLDTVHETGDHLLVVGRVTDMGVGPGHPLLFYRGGFANLEI